jgi:hypothetical protein
MRFAAPAALGYTWCKAGAVLAVGLLGLLPFRVQAQEEAGREPTDTATAAEGSYPNDIAGEFTPAKGFDIAKTKIASLNISFYGLFRYMNQMPGEQTFTDHLGRERPVKARNDLNWHRTFVWLTGFFYDPKFRYNIALVAAHHPADPAVRQPPVPVQQGHRHRSGNRPQPDRAIGAGLLAVLGLQRPADGRGFLSWRIFVRLLCYRSADPEVLVYSLGKHQHQPAWHHRRQRHP